MERQSGESKSVMEMDPEATPWDPLDSGADGKSGRTIIDDLKKGPIPIPGRFRKYTPPIEEDRFSWWTGIENIDPWKIPFLDYFPHGPIGIEWAGTMLLTSDGGS